MEQEQFFLECTHCGNLVGVLHDSGVPLLCCGEKMTILSAKEDSDYKHKPKVAVKGGLVMVEIGEAHHPMEKEHQISWVYLQTERGGQRKSLVGRDVPKVWFAVTEEDEPLAVFAYCNQHGLWKTTADEFH